MTLLSAILSNAADSVSTLFSLFLSSRARPPHLVAPNPNFHNSSVHSSALGSSLVLSLSRERNRCLVTTSELPSEQASTFATHGSAPGNDNLLQIGHVGHVNNQDDALEAERFTNCVDEIVARVDEMEQKVNEVTQFYSSLSKKQGNTKGGMVGKDKDKEKQITAHKWSWPFMHPVDVEGLGLHDYHQSVLIRHILSDIVVLTFSRGGEYPWMMGIYPNGYGYKDFKWGWGWGWGWGWIQNLILTRLWVIAKPMDLTKIKNQMEAKDGTGYKNIRDIYSDVRLVFKNAMTYNEERSDAYVMAKTLLEKFEEKWLQLLPKVVEEEAKRKEEEAEAQLDMQLAQEAANAKKSRDINNELFDVQMDLEELRDMVVQKCRKMTVEEKRKLGSGLSQLSPEDLTKGLEIIAEKNSNFQPTAEEVDIDIDAQSELTLWRLKFFVKEALEANKGKGFATKVGNDNSKRKREICEALAKTAKKRSKKLPS
ncbi:hypothetical protein Syun_028265 [Stephania yunnanensis]|uniref:Uncharacterized protein n=1 Tax=Stephania yunnanensis TaxID=152371 RepID=A0AAP0EQZ3_9MAGN